MCHKGLFVWDSLEARSIDTVTSQGSNDCNHTLIIDVFELLNQIDTNSIEFNLNSKTRTEF
jgi:hypothetical protein